MLKRKSQQGVMDECVPGSFGPNFTKGLSGVLFNSPSYSAAYDTGDSNMASQSTDSGRSDNLPTGMQPKGVPGVDLPISNPSYYAT